MAKRVVITGTAGFLGPDVAQYFVEQGYDVLSVDIKVPTKPKARHLIADLTHLGECYEVMKGAFALVHLAAVPRVGIVTDQKTFENNVLCTYNLLEACSGLGIKKVVIASSECAYGFCFCKNLHLHPKYLPVDEDHPLLPEDAYGLSKVVIEQIADMFHRRDNIQIVSMRLGNIITKEKYLEFPSWIHDSQKRKENIWNYIDSRDIASACKLAIEKDGLGSVVVNIAADDNSMDIKSCDLIKAQYPEVTDIRAPVDQYQTLYSNTKAKKLLGWQPVHFWRDNVKL